MCASYYIPYLAHHGIKGQRWGVKNGPPYPLKQGVKKKDALHTNAQDGKLKYIDYDIFSLLVYAGAAVAAGIIAKMRDKKLDPQRIAIGREYSKRIIHLSYDDVKHKPNDKVSNYISNRNENTNMDKKTGLPIKKEIGNQKDDLEVTNMEFKSYNLARNNCGLCSATYDMRRRGYDVIANYSTAEGGGVTIGTIESWYKGGKFKPITGSKDRYYLSTTKAMRGLNQEEATQSIERLSKNKNSRGILGVTWAFANSGHAMNYEVDNDGLVTLICPQSNKTWVGKKAVRLLRAMSSAMYMRTDNLEPNIDIMKKEGVFR